MRCGVCGKEVPPESDSCPWCAGGGKSRLSLRRKHEEDADTDSEAYSGYDDMGGRKPARFTLFHAQGMPGGARRKTALLILVASLVVLAGAYLAVNGLPAAALPNSTAANASTAVPASGSGNTPAPAAGISAHYYNVENRVSIDYPAGWIKNKEEDYQLFATNRSYTEMIALQAEAIDSTVSMSEMTEDEIAQFRDMALFNDMLKSAGLDGDAGDAACSDKYINGYRFIQYSFQILHEGKSYRVFAILGVYDSRQILMAFLAPADDSEALDYLLGYADTFRFGEDAKP